MRVLVIGTEDMTGEHVVKQLADRHHNPGTRCSFGKKGFFQCFFRL